MRLVVDASLATKWIVPEPDSEQAWRFAERYAGDLDAPDLLHVEVMGVLVRLANQRSIAPERAGLDLDRWTAGWNAGALRTHRVTQAMAHGAARLAIELGHPIKDCVYLALADQLGCPVATSGSATASVTPPASGCSPSLFRAMHRAHPAVRSR